MSYPIRLIGSPRGNGRFSVSISGGTENIVKTSAVPFMAACRELMKSGFTGNEEAEFYHEGSPVVAMRGIVGEVAKWTVTERDRGGLYKTPYVESPYASK